MKLYVAFILIFLIGCKNPKSQEVTAVIKNQEISNTLPKSNKYSSIENLKLAFSKKDYELFLKEFPENFEQFHHYFGWDYENDKPNELYEESNEYIDYFFGLLDKKEYQEFETKLVGIGKNGQWQPDAVNYFQDGAMKYIKKERRYELINDLNSETAKSVLFFLFDGPHPKFDTDFTSHLSPSKKGILKELFQTSFYDANENPDPILPDLETPDPIDYEGSIAYAIADFEHNEHYFIRDIDIDNDGVLDKIVSAGRYQGDELLLFINKGGTYQFALKTTNFSEDGGNQIVDVIAEEDGFVIKTAFSDREFFEAIYHITFKNEKWELTNTVYKTQSNNQEDAFIYTCDVSQKLNYG